MIRYGFDGPIALPREDGTAELVNLNAGIVEEPGEDLPGLLGIDVLKLTTSHYGHRQQTIHIPRTWRSGNQTTRWINCDSLFKAPSGHLLVAIDCYEQVSKQQGGLATSIQSLKQQRNNTDPVQGQSESIVQSAAECVPEVLGGSAPRD